MYAKLFEPSYDSKHQRFLKHYVRSQTYDDVDIEKIKQQLKSQRSRNIARLLHSAEKFQKTLSTCDTLQTFFAASDDEASRIIRDLVGNQDSVYVNNSGTVQEISDELQNQGIDVARTYFADQTIKENRFQHAWQLPDFKSQLFEDYFSIQKKFPVCDRSEEIAYYDTTALIGVNSAAADDGTICLLQHSSNIEKLLQARQIIFLVGLEKIVSNQDEAKFQTRWAGNFGLPYVLMNLDKTTGEPQTGHDRLFSGLFTKTGRKPGISVIILDNGRSKLLNGPFEEVLHCISCRSCISGCPNYKFFGKALGRYPQQYLFLFLIGKTNDLELCSYCNNCSFDCPVGIDLANMNSLAKGMSHSRLDRFKNRLIGNPPMLANLTKVASPIAESMAKNKIVKLATEKTIGIHRNRPLPVYDKVKMLSPIRRTASQKKKTLTYYPGCWANFFEHDVFNATLKLFHLIDYEIQVPSTQCCGLPLIASGEIESAKKKARIVVKHLNDSHPDADIIMTCPSCSLAIKKDYIDLGITGAEALSKRVYDVQEYILNLSEIATGQLQFRALHTTIGYHLPCHQRVQDLNQTAMKVLKLIPGLSVTAVDRGCCGISGTFGQKKQYYQYAMETGREMFDAIAEQDPAMMCTECGPCKMQIVHGTQKKTMHPITLLAELAYLNDS